MLRLTDLREILRYVPRFRDRTFVIALDGALVEDDNWPNLLLDFALLRSLSINVVLVHGAAHQVEHFGRLAGIRLSNLDGTGVTDPPTLQLAMTAANRVTHEILEGLSAHDLRAACPNAVVAHPAGILGGVDHQLTGRVERIDTVLLQTLLQGGIVPVVPPLGCDGEGRTYRLNSDAVAVELARALQAVKLVYLASGPGLVLQGQLLRQLSVTEADDVLRRHRHEFESSDAASKLAQAIRAATAGVDRVHVVDGRLEMGLLAEVFSNEGIGTLIYVDEYQAIRRARKRDLRALHRLIQEGVANEELVRRTRAELERQLDDFFVFEVDRTPIGCAAMHTYPEEGKAELACVYVDPRYENRGVGARLIAYVERQAREAGYAMLLCLSTQAVNYFVQKCGFRLGTPDDLPQIRRAAYNASPRRSQVLVKTL